MRRIAPLLVLLFSATAKAESTRSPEDIASEAYFVHGDHCGQARSSRTLAVDDEVKVTAMLRDVSATFDRSQKNYLLYWRALLGECLDKRGDAEKDLDLFLSRAGTDPGSAGLVDDARRRFRRLVNKRLQEEGKFRSPVVVSLDGGWQRAAAFDYVALGATVGVRTPKVLVVEAGVRVQISGLLRDSSGAVVDPADVSVFPVVVAGPVAVLDLKVRPMFGVLFQGGFNTAGDAGLPFMPGIAGVVGVEVPLRKGAPVALRARVEGGVLERYPSIRALAGLTLGF